MTFARLRVGYPDGSGITDWRDGKACAHIIASDGTGECIVRGGNPEGDLTYGVLNLDYANLFAAAPEMYEALQSVLPHLLDETQQPLADGIRLVLAKAEGGAR